MSLNIFVGWKIKAIHRIILPTICNEVKTAFNPGIRHITNQKNHLKTLAIFENTWGTFAITLTLTFPSSGSWPATCPVAMVTLSGCTAMLSIELTYLLIDNYAKHSKSVKNICYMNRRTSHSTFAWLRNAWILDLLCHRLISLITDGIWLHSYNFLMV